MVLVEAMLANVQNLVLENHVKVMKAALQVNTVVIVVEVVLANVQNLVLENHVKVIEAAVSGEYCCDRGQSDVGECATSCIGKSCKFMYLFNFFINYRHCPSGEYCCDLGENSVGKCAASCVRKSCEYIHPVRIRRTLWF